MNAKVVGSPVNRRLGSAKLVLSRWLVSGTLALALVAGITGGGVSAARKSQAPPQGRGDTACVLTVGTGGQAWRRLAAHETLCASQR